MKITPLATYRPRPYALLHPGHRSLTIDTLDDTTSWHGVRAVEKALGQLAAAKAVCYVEAGLSALRHTTGALSWTMATWRGRETRMTHNPTGLVVTSLRGALEGSEDVFHSLSTTLDWLHEYGVTPASVSSMAWSLWRASLSTPVVIGADPDVSRPAVYGGRQEITEARSFSHMVSADIRGAYPHSMASSPYALSLKNVSPETVLDPTIPGLARATVWVDSDMPFAPLPTRIGPGLIQFQWGTVKGLWPWSELAAAKAVGAEVRVIEAWAPRRTADLFGPWWEITQEGRALPDSRSATLAKAIANTLWGQFGMTGYDRAEVHWSDDRGELAYQVSLPGRTMPHEWTAHIAAETTGRVRTRLLVEGLYGTKFRPVHADTDGIIVRRRSHLPVPHGPGPGQWRVKERMTTVDIKAPQLYRFTCGKPFVSGCGVDHAPNHYVASGLTESQAPQFFRKGANRRTRISYMNAFDNCLPPAHSDDPILTTLAGIERREMA